MDGMHVWSTASSFTFEAFTRTRAFVFTLFLLCRGFSVFWPARFLTSSCPIVIFRLTSFRLVRHDRFFSSLSSLFVCSVFQRTPSHLSCTTWTWQSLQNLWTSVRRQAMDWESFFFAVRAAGRDIRTRSRSWPFWRADRISTCIMTGAQKPRDFILSSHDWKMFEFLTDECVSGHNERIRSIQIDKNFITQTFRMYNFIIMSWIGW